MAILPRWLKRPANLDQIPDGYVLTTSGGDVAFAQTSPGGPPGAITKEQIEAVLIGEISSHTHAGGEGLSQPQIMARSLGC